MGTRALLSSTALYRKQLYWVYPLGAGGIAILQYTEHLCTTPVQAKIGVRQTARGGRGHDGEDEA